MSDKLSAPEKLSPTFDVASFDSGEIVLDDWLRRRALPNEESGASRTYVVRAGIRVVGYYSLAVGAVSHDAVTGRMRRNMPQPIPVMILGRLAVDREFQGRGLGAGLLRDAVLRSIQAGQIAGIRGMLVHTISENARRFYESHGFVASPVDPLIVMITLSDAEKILGSGFV
jgi:GNAT superfamily N-acetyltransferase